LRHGKLEAAIVHEPHAAKANRHLTQKMCDAL
jgi:hypothetical protein